MRGGQKEEKRERRRKEGREKKGRKEIYTYIYKIYILYTIVATVVYRKNNVHRHIYNYIITFP